MTNYFKCLPKWRNFAKSGHTAFNLSRTDCKSKFDAFWHVLLSNWFSIVETRQLTSRFVKSEFILTFEKVFFKWANIGLFFVFSVFLKKQYNFYNKSMWKMSCPSSKRCWDSNPQPFEHKSSHITTRPELPPNWIWKTFFMLHPSNALTV